MTQIDLEDEFKKLCLQIESSENELKSYEVRFDLKKQDMLRTKIKIANKKLMLF